MSDTLSYEGSLRRSRWFIDDHGERELRSAANNDSYTVTDRPLVLAFGVASLRERAWPWEGASMLDDRSLLHGIQDLNLDMIRQKLLDPDEGNDWTGEHCDRAIEEYRRFLALTRAYPSLTLVPSHAVDKVWHAHILDTQRYGEDCQRIFGHFLHHFPYLGMRGTADKVAHLSAMEKILELYRKHFGEPALDLWVSSAQRPPKCGAPTYLPV